MKSLLTHILRIIILMVMAEPAVASSVHWKSLGSDVEAFDSMMERAAFLDVPRRDLRAVVARVPLPSDPVCRRQAVARGDYWKAWVLLKQNPDSAHRLVESALAECDSAAYPYDHARFKLLYADLLRDNGNFARAYSIYRDKIDVIRRFGDDFWVAKAKVCVGAIMQELGEVHEALRNFTEAQDIFRNVGSDACLTKNRINLSNVHYLMGHKEKGLEMLAGLESDANVADDSVYVANVLISRFHISDYTDCEAAVKAYEISRRLENAPLSVIAMLAMGQLAVIRKDYRLGVRYMRPALDIASSLADFPNRKKLLEGLRVCYSAMGMKDSAEYCSAEITLLNDSLYYQESVAELKRAEHLATITRYEEQLKTEADKHSLRLLLSVCSAVVLLVILILSVSLLRVSKCKAESERDLKEEKNRQLMMQNRQYSMEIEAKEKELASNTLLLAQKNARLKELAGHIQQMERRGALHDSESRELNDKISDELTADDDWGFFKMRFDKVHPCFFQSLRDTWPALSRTELRICAYIRVGMSAKEIAQVLSVKPDTVNTSRYRIRKKMGLASEDSLEGVLDNF